MKEEPSVWKIRAILWLPLLVLIFPEAFVISLTPPWVFTTSLYLASFVGWAILARIMMPLQFRVPGKVKAKGPIIRWSHFIIILFLVGGLTEVSSVMVPVAAGIVGWMLGLTAFAAHDFLWNIKFRYCNSCQKRMGFRRHAGKFYCEKCGSVAIAV